MAMRLNDMRRETQTDVAIIIPTINDARIYNTDIPLVGRRTHTPLSSMMLVSMARIASQKG